MGTSLSLKPLIYKHLNALCNKTEAGTVDTGFTTPIVHKAAKELPLKLLKYSGNINCNTTTIALFLDPRSGNEPSDMLQLKDCIQHILSVYYCMFLDEPQAVPAIGAFHVFAGVSFDGQKQPNVTDEVDHFLTFTAKADRFVSDVLEW